MTETADVLVIGGGIAGIGAAGRIAPDARVIVLEAEDTIGHHSTGRSAAIFIRNYGNATLRALNAASEPELLDPVGIAETSVLSPRGEMMVATSEEELPELAAYREGSDGIEPLTREEALALCPILRPDRVVEAAIERAAQDIDVDRLLQGFARAVRSHGGRIATGAGVVSLARQGAVWRVQSKAGVFEAPIVVNAAGAWADELAALAGVRRVNLRPLRRSAAILPAPVGANVAHWPMVVSASETWYMKPEAGKLMVSPADEDPVDPHDAWPDEMVLAEGLYRFEQAVTMPVTRVEHRWAGLRSFVADRTPVVGFAPDAEGFFWLAGQGGYGVQTSPAMSRLAADLIAHRAPHVAESVVASLSPTRDSLKGELALTEHPVLD